MKQTVRLFYFLLGLTAARLAAQLAAPSPLVSAITTARLEPGRWTETEGRADRALQLGFCVTAATLYQGLLADFALPAESKQRIALSRVSALMDAGMLAEAETELKNYDGPHNAVYQLKVGLIASVTRHPAQAKAALAAVKFDDLAAVDRGWWFFLQATVADSDGEFPKANSLYEQAFGAAVSELQRARFMLGQEQALLRRGPLDEAHLAAQRARMDALQGRSPGYDAARTYATALAALGRGVEAQQVLNRQLAIIPPTERNVADQFRLMLGLIAGDGSGVGRQAFRQVLRDGQKPETQRLALQLLARGAKTAADREQLGSDLSELIDAAPPNPIIEDLYLARAQAALIDKDYSRAEEDARTLLERYPGTPLKAAALGVRLAVAWDSKRYRAAADVISLLHDTLPVGRERAELGVLLAEAFFHAAELSANPGDDYRNAADAYDAAMREPPPDVKVGTLIFQRVLSDIRAGAERLEVAARQLDAAADNPDLDPVSRWQAEWNLVREMQKQGQANAAYQRVDRLLGGAAAGVPAELRIRLMWLRAKLSFDDSQPARAQQQSDELLKLLEAGGLTDAALRVEVTATTQLLEAQALLALGKDGDGFELMKKLRADFHATEAAKYSYLVQANFLTQRGDLAAAQGELLRFVDDAEYQKSEYAPTALYEVALILERQGLDRQLREAYTKLEQLIKNYPDNRLVFYARLKQGDLLRMLNEFPAARLIYEDLVHHNSGHPDELLAELALADCFFALGANSVSNYGSASSAYERLRDLPSAPVDLRAEAGFKWGYALAKRALAATAPAEREPQLAKAQSVFWSVVDSFLLQPAQAEKLGAKGRYWVSRSLLELGQLDEETGQLDEAQRAYQLILDQKLSGGTQAQAKLARFRSSGGAKP